MAADECQRTWLVSTWWLPSENVPVATKLTLVPLAIVGLAGLTVIFFSLTRCTLTRAVAVVVPTRAVTVVVPRRTPVTVPRMQAPSPHTVAIVGSVVVQPAAAVRSAVLPSA